MISFIWWNFGKQNTKQVEKRKTKLGEEQQTEEEYWYELCMLTTVLRSSGKEKAPRGETHKVRTRLSPSDQVIVLIVTAELTNKLY